MAAPSPQLVSEREHGMWLLVHGLRNLTPEEPLRPGEFQIDNYAGQYCFTENGWSKNVADAVTFNEREEAEKYRDRRTHAFWRERSGKAPGEGVPWPPLPE